MKKLISLVCTASIMASILAPVAQVKCKYYVDSAHKKFACNDTFYRAWG